MRKIFKDSLATNDLSHPLFENLRKGNWLLDYYVGRLGASESLKGLQSAIDVTITKIKAIPRYLIPRFFSDFMLVLYRCLDERLATTVSKSLKAIGLESSEFLRSLVCLCYHFISEGKLTNEPSKKPVTMSAGLPHFSTGLMRAWGRDTFVAFNGVLLQSGMLAEAKTIILEFARTLRHGLLPNLYNFGDNPRYNCRDAVWFYIKAIKDYIEATNDYEILKEKVTLLFHSNSQAEHNKKVEAKEALPTLSLAQVIQRVFEEHVAGISFREWNAGPSLSWEMGYHGFNIALKLDHTTGLVIGGNSHNCLTWMDKLGSWNAAGNLGVPATPRDGAPIELTGLIHMALSFVIDLNAKGHFEWKEAKGLPYSHWKKAIEESFEREYWDEDHGVLRDTVRGEKPVEQSFLRSNVLVALTVAPDLLSIEKTKRCIENVERWLIVTIF